VIFAAQGHGLERDHLDEAVEQPEVAGIYRKAMGPGPLIEAIDIAVKGGSLTTPGFPWRQPAGCPADSCLLREGERDHRSAAGRGDRSGRAVNHETLASAAHVGYDTAAKLVDYLGPLISERCEHSRELKMTPKWSTGGVASTRDTS